MLVLKVAQVNAIPSDSASTSIWCLAATLPEMFQRVEVGPGAL